MIFKVVYYVGLGLLIVARVALEAKVRGILGKVYNSLTDTYRKSIEQNPEDR